MLPVHDQNHAELAWRLVERVELTTAERTSARARITECLSNFGVDAESLSWGNSVPIMELGTTQLMTLVSFAEDLSLTDAEEMLEALSLEAAKRMADKFRKLHELDQLGNPENYSGNVACQWNLSDGYSVEMFLSESGKKLRIPVARKGTFVHPRYGTVDFNQRDFDEMRENFTSNEAGFRPYLRYGHAMFPEAADAEPAVAYLETLEQEGDVLWGIYDPINDEVVEQVEKGAYVGASAELKRYAMSKRDGRPIGTLLTAHALTNAPFVPDLPRNEVLSDAAAGAARDPFITLCMSDTKGDPGMKTNMEQLLSDALGALEALSMSDAEREKIKAKMTALAGAGDQNAYDSNKSAGVTGDDPAANKLSDPTATVVDKPAGVLGTDPAANKLADNSEPTEDKEEMSSFVGELLSNIGMFLKRGGKAKAEKLSDNAVPAAAPIAQPAPAVEQTPTEQALSTGAASAEGGAEMTEDQIKALVTSAVGAVEQKFTDGMAAKDAQIADLQAKLTATQTQAQQFSNSLVENAFENRVANLVAAGIPAVTVHAVAGIAREMRGTVQKFSDGSELDTAEALFRALETLPGDARVNYEQSGQQFSDSASAATGADSYAGILADMLGQSNG